MITGGADVTIVSSLLLGAVVFGTITPVAGDDAENVPTEDELVPDVERTGLLHNGDCTK